MIPTQTFLCFASTINPTMVKVNLFLSQESSRVCLIPPDPLASETERVQICTASLLTLLGLSYLVYRLCRGREKVQDDVFRPILPAPAKPRISTYEIQPSGTRDAGQQQHVPRRQQPTRKRKGPIVPSSTELGAQSTAPAGLGPEEVELMRKRYSEGKVAEITICVQYRNGILEMNINQIAKIHPTINKRDACVKVKRPAERRISVPLLKYARNLGALVGSNSFKFPVTEDALKTSIYWFYLWSIDEKSRQKEYGKFPLHFSEVTGNNDLGTGCFLKFDFLVSDTSPLESEPCLKLKLNYNMQAAKLIVTVMEITELVLPSGTTGIIPPETYIKVTFHNTETDRRTEHKTMSVKGKDPVFNSTFHYPVMVDQKDGGFCVLFFRLWTPLSLTRSPFPLLIMTLWVVVLVCTASLLTLLGLSYLVYRLCRGREKVQDDVFRPILPAPAKPRISTYEIQPSGTRDAGQQQHVPRRQQPTRKRKGPIVPSSTELGAQSTAPAGLGPEEVELMRKRYSEGKVAEITICVQYRNGILEMNINQIAKIHPTINKRDACVKVKRPAERRISVPLLKYARNLGALVGSNSFKFPVTEDALKTSIYWFYLWSIDEKSRQKEYGKFPLHFSEVTGNNDLGTGCFLKFDFLVSDTSPLESEPCLKLKLNYNMQAAKLIVTVMEITELVLPSGTTGIIPPETYIKVTFHNTETDRRTEHKTMSVKGKDPVFNSTFHYPVMVDQLDLLNLVVDVKSKAIHTETLAVLEFSSHSTGRQGEHWMEMIQAISCRNGAVKSHRIALEKSQGAVAAMNRNMRRMSTDILAVTMGNFRIVTGLLILLGSLCILLIILGAAYSPNQFYGARFVVGSCQLITRTIDPGDMSLVSCDCSEADDEYSCTGYYPCLEAYAYWYDNKNFSAPPKKGLLAYDASSAKRGCLASTTCTDSYSRNEASLMNYWERLENEIINDLDNWFRCYYHDEAILLDNKYSFGKGLAAIVVPAILIVITYLIILWIIPSETCYITWWPCIMLWLCCCVDVIWKSCLRDFCRSIKRKVIRCCSCCEKKEEPERDDDREMGSLQQEVEPPYPAAAHRITKYDRRLPPENYTRRSSSSSSESEKGSYGGYKSTLADSPKMNSPTLSDRYQTSYSPPPADLPPPSYNDVVDAGDRYEAPTEVVEWSPARLSSGRPGIETPPGPDKVVMGNFRLVTGLLILLGSLCILLIILGAAYSPNQFYGARFVVGSCQLITRTIDPGDMSLVSCDCSEADDEYSCTGYYPCLEAYAYWYDNKNFSAPPKKGLLAYDASSAKRGCLASTTCTDSYSRNEASLMNYWERLENEIINDLDNWFRCYYHDEAILLDNKYSFGKGLAAIVVPAILIVITYLIILMDNPI
eukprot:sb/3460991/